MNLLENLRASLEPIILSFGVNVWDIVLEKEGKNKFLRIYIFRSSGASITLDDCEMVSKAVSKRLDDIDIIKSRYYLEVSSVGVGRKLTKEKHFLNSIGSKVYIKFKRHFTEFKNLKGVLKEYALNKIKIENKGEIFEFLLENCSYVKLDDEM